MGRPAVISIRWLWVEPLCQSVDTSHPSSHPLRVASSTPTMQARTWAKRREGTRPSYKVAKLTLKPIICCQTNEKSWLITLGTFSDYLFHVSSEEEKCN